VTKSKMKCEDNYPQKDVKIKRLEKLAEQLQKKARQGSNEEQGTGFEQEIATYLRECVQNSMNSTRTRGKRGADIVQRRKNQWKKCCGTIIWGSQIHGQTGSKAGSRH